MRVIVQRVVRAEVREGGSVRGSIGRGFVGLVGVETPDGAAEAARMAEKLAHLRFFEDSAGKMNQSVLEAGGDVLLVPNFTVAGSTRKGRRPSFDGAKAPEEARCLFDAVCEEMVKLGVRVERGVFGAEMQVELVNDGPVTLLVEVGSDQISTFAR
ncbi:MAG: D-tyrosyl-tRNA(Tyr) deacylase [Phycisphaeraceae bacterium]|nr:D-tyrosyl-tRNA(Tyr) deacylase [Phycisphaeraceae bacterium]MCW5754573.1 D-tyrosyl-tRNA(Tyr) deacylase [Phycisphaeraceae bacterium]